MIFLLHSFIHALYFFSWRCNHVILLKYHEVSGFRVYRLEIAGHLQLSGLYLSSSWSICAFIRQSSNLTKVHVVCALADANFVFLFLIYSRNPMDGRRAPNVLAWPAEAWKRRLAWHSS